MNEEKEFPKRKHPRLNEYDYSFTGSYFVTICTQSRQCILSRVFRQISDSAEAVEFKIEHTLFGKIAEKQLLLLEDRYPHLSVDVCIIMPDHIHAILTLKGKTEQEISRSKIMDIMCTYKSLTTRECKRNGFEGKLFQTSFFEHVIRGREDYNETVKYICENPMRWYFKHLG